MWLIENGFEERRSLDPEDSMGVMVDNLGALLDRHGPQRMAQEFATAFTTDDQHAILAELWRHDDPESSTDPRRAGGALSQAAGQGRRQGAVQASHRGATPVAAARAPTPCQGDWDMTAESSGELVDEACQRGAERLRRVVRTWGCPKPRSRAVTEPPWTDPLDGDAPGWIEWGGQRILVMGCTSGGAPYGLREDELRGRRPASRRSRLVEVSGCLRRRTGRRRPRRWRP
jgi:hypothetical protein